MLVLHRLLGDRLGLGQADFAGHGGYQVGVRRFREGDVSESLVGRRLDDPIGGPQHQSNQGCRYPHPAAPPEGALEERQADGSRDHRPGILRLLSSGTRERC